MTNTIRITNCPEYRDSYGHFCDTEFNNDNDNNGGDGAAIQCVSVQKQCNLYLDKQQQSCPTTCLQQCPSWVATDPSTFLVSSHDCWYRCWMSTNLMRSHSNTIN